VSVIAMRRCFSRFAKSDATALAGKTAAVKLATDEKFGQAALEYLYEQNKPDAPKTRDEINDQRALSQALDRFYAIGDAEFTNRLDRLALRSMQVMQSLPPDLQVEASVLNSEQAPLNFRRPTLTPPLMGYEAAFGLDVPQLRSRIVEYPERVPLDDEMSETTLSYPFVEPDLVEDLNRDVSANVHSAHEAARSTIPVTGPAGEAWEAQVRLQTRACKRQKLLLRLAEDDTFRERYESDIEFRQEVSHEHDLIPLVIEQPAVVHTEGAMPRPASPVHHVQRPKSLERKA
jgi:hypothetical protein